jgi:hypothetical protein
LNWFLSGFDALHEYGLDRVGAPVNQRRGLFAFGGAELAQYVAGVLPSGWPAEADQRLPDRSNPGCTRAAPQCGSPPSHVRIKDQLDLITTRPATSACRHIGAADDRGTSTFLGQAVKHQPRQNRADSTGVRKKFGECF